MQNTKTRVLLIKDNPGDIRVIQEVQSKDNGNGLPEGFDIDTTKTLGMRLVNLLVEDQLWGHMEIISKQGTAFNMKFNIYTGVIKPKEHIKQNDMLNWRYIVDNWYPVFHPFTKKFTGYMGSDKFYRVES